MYHWTDSKIRVHAFYCMLGLSLLQYLHKQAETVWPGLSVEQLLEELRQIQPEITVALPGWDREAAVSMLKICEEHFDMTPFLHYLRRRTCVIAGSRS